MWSLQLCQPIGFMLSMPAVETKTNPLHLASSKANGLWGIIVIVIIHTL